METSGYSKKTVDVDNRRFSLEMVRFDNGCFLSISEGQKKIGTMMVSLGIGPSPTSATVIPGKTDSLFLKLTAEKISSYFKGVGIVSLYTNKELGNNVAKKLMEKIMEMVKSE